MSIKIASRAVKLNKLLNYHVLILVLSFNVDIKQTKMDSFF